MNIKGYLILFDTGKGVIMSRFFRFKCPNCGKVQDALGDGPCNGCQTMIKLPQDGIIQIYRMSSCGGNFGRSMEVFINGIRIGRLKNEDVTRIPVPYGHYHVMAKFLDYKLSKYQGIGLEFDVTPENRIVNLKAARCLPGYLTNTVILEQASLEEIQRCALYLK